jgi:hypothetical protein
MARSFEHGRRILLSYQWTILVPAKVVFLTDGPSRTVFVGGTTIQLRRTTPRNMEPSGRLSGLLIQAYRDLAATRT